jgi:superfamily I DNA/RNA helicase
MNIETFVNSSKSMIIAPAGYGKTYTIADCVLFAQNNNMGKQLILTHTHAGIISIKEKLKRLDVSSKSFNVETITSFAQKYVLSFYKGEIPLQENSRVYYPFILDKANELFKIQTISKIVSSTYSGLFVDEYQDCTIKQHNIILSLAQIIPTHILGDPLQGIFNFGGDRLVDLESREDMGNFLDNSQVLDTPWRWINAERAELGWQVHSMRQRFLNGNRLNIREFNAVEVNISDDVFSRQNYNTIMNLINTERSLLFLDPITTNVASRIAFTQRFLNRVNLIEAIDSEDFYLSAKLIDEINSNNLILHLRRILIILSTTTAVNNWLTLTGVKNKRETIDKSAVTPLSKHITNLVGAISKEDIYNAIESFFLLPDVKCYRKEILWSLKKAILLSMENNTTVYESMIHNRNNIRRLGRKVDGVCIGTTLLTKGLEFDTVVVLNAHRFENMRHLYVALTRASRRLIVFTNNPILPS